MSKEFDLETLTRPGGLVPVDVETTAALVRQVIRLRTALEFYAEEANYRQFFIASKGFSVSETLCDNGRKAREALGVTSKLTP